MVLSTFDIKYMQKKTKEKQEQFWEDKCLLVRKTKLFLRTKVLFPFLFYTIILGFGVWLIIYWFDDFNIQLAFILFWVLLWLLPMLLNEGIFKRYLDYKLDFIIVTPETIFRYDQSWILKRASKAIDKNHIKTISIQKYWLLYSIFNNWDLEIMTDMGGQDAWNKNIWEIHFKYIWNPEKIRQKIRDIMKEDVMEW